MSATIIDGKAVAARVRAEVARDVEALRGRDRRAARPRDGARRRRPRVGDLRRRQAEGLRRGRHQPASTTACRRTPAHDELAALLDELAADDAVSGILLQLPVPGHIDVRRDDPAPIPPDKDVDGLTPISAGRLALGLPGSAAVHARRASSSCSTPTTSRSRAPRRWSSGARTWSASPSAQLLLERNATVTVCHSRTRDLADGLRSRRRADRRGRARRMVKGDWVKPGAAVIDVGHEPHRRRPVRRRGLRGRGRAGRRSSRRCPAASAR